MHHSINIEESCRTQMLQGSELEHSEAGRVIAIMLCLIDRDEEHRLMRNDDIVLRITVTRT